MRFINTISRLFHGPNLGLFVIRMAIGAIGFYHGAQKLFGAFGGKGISGMAKDLEGINIPFPMVSATLAGLAEFVGGILIAIGLFTRFSALVFGFTMVVAVHALIKWNKQLLDMEYPILVGLVCLGLIFTGPGTWSLQPWAEKILDRKKEKKED